MCCVPHTFNAKHSIQTISIHRIHCRMHKISMSIRCTNCCEGLPARQCYKILHVKCISCLCAPQSITSTKHKFKQMHSTKVKRFSLHLCCTLRITASSPNQDIVFAYVCVSLCVSMSIPMTFYVNTEHFMHLSQNQ